MGKNKLYFILKIIQLNDEKVVFFFYQVLVDEKQISLEMQSKI